MLSFAGIPVVMGNGVPELKARGWRVTGSNEDDGVAAAISAIRLTGGAGVRLRHILASMGCHGLSLCAATAARAEYIVLHSGARLNVTGYQLFGDKYRLQMVAVLPKCPRAEVLAIEPQEVFDPSLSLSATNTPSAKLSVRPPRAMTSTQT